MANAAKIAINQMHGISAQLKCFFDHLMRFAQRLHLADVDVNIYVRSVSPRWIRCWSGRKRPRAMCLTALVAPLSSSAILPPAPSSKEWYKDGKQVNPPARPSTLAQDDSAPSPGLGSGCRSPSCGSPVRQSRITTILLNRAGGSKPAL